MRRPLFTTGIPQIPPVVGDIVATPNAALSVLDLRSFSTVLQSHTRFVTLFAASQAFGVTEEVELAWREGTSTPLLLTTLEMDGSTGIPVKVLDRFPLRGNAELLVSNVADAAAVWGYFELEGSSNLKIVDRPLQPGALITPFTYVPASTTTDVVPLTLLHTLVNGYFDEIDLDVSARALDGVAVNLTITDGVNTVVVDVAGGGRTPSRIFDGIPMGSNVSAGGGISISSVDPVAQVSAWGSFIRVS